MALTLRDMHEGEKQVKVQTQGLVVKKGGRTKLRISFVVFHPPGDPDINKSFNAYVDLGDSEDPVVHPPV